MKYKESPKMIAFEVFKGITIHMDENWMVKTSIDVLVDIEPFVVLTSHSIFEAIGKWIHSWSIGRYEISRMDVSDGKVETSRGLCRYALTINGMPIEQGGFAFGFR